LRGGKAAVCQKAMIPYVHAERAEDVATQHRKHDPCPTEEPGQARENRDKMDENDRGGISPLDAPRAMRRRSSGVIGIARFKIVVQRYDQNCSRSKWDGTACREPLETITILSLVAGEAAISRLGLGNTSYWLKYAL